jgi:glycosyltransferase involved in cell wall biosynthesis
MKTINSFPSVSVLMTAYNREKFIAEAIESVLASSFRDFELIIVDDCSNDQTLAIANFFKSKDSRIRVYSNEKNVGDYHNRNIAAQHATGDVIISVDSDDTIKVNAISHIVELFQLYTEADFLTINRDDFFSVDCVIDSHHLLRRHFFQKPSLYIGPGGTAIRTNYFRRIGGFPTLYGPANDMYYNLLCASKSSVILCKFEFLNYRIHEEQEQSNKLRYLDNNYKYFNDALRNLNLFLTEKEKVLLLLKNKRRFVVNTFLFILGGENILSIWKCWRSVSFNIFDVLEGVFLKRIK